MKSNLSNHVGSYLVATLLLAFTIVEAHKTLAEDLNANNSLQEYVNHRREEWLNSTWQGKLIDGKSITANDIQAVINKHEQWLATNGKEGDKADLSGAKLANAYFDFVNLCWAKLRSTDLSSSELSHALFIRADLQKAIFNGSNLLSVTMTGADLTECSFISSDLEDADMSEAVLIGADFTKANLRNVNMYNTDVTQAKFNFALGLTELREAFKKSGDIQNSRTLTYFINRNRRVKQLRGGLIEKAQSIANFMLFEITSKYGLVPYRPLVVLFLLIPVFSSYYTIVLLRPKSDGICLKWNQYRVRPDIGGDKSVLLQKGFWSALCWGGYFSLLSAFHIGWKDFTIGGWLKKLQRHDYSLEATGWARTISGLQALISLYLLSLTVACYFGKIFE